MRYQLRKGEADPPSSLAWDTGPFAGDLDLLGNTELRLDATASSEHTGQAGAAL